MARTIQYSKIYDYLTGSLYPYFWSAGGEVWDPATGKVSGVLNTDKNAEMLALAKSMMNYCPPGAIDVDIGGIVENLHDRQSCHRLAVGRDGFYHER